MDCVLSWSQAKLDPQCVVFDPMSRYLSQPNQPPVQDSRTMYRTFELVFDLWHHGKGNLAGLAARKGFYVLEYVLTEDHPDMIWHVLDIIYDMIDQGHLQLLGILLQHTLILARRHLPQNHPLLKMVEQLQLCDYQSDQGRQYVCHFLRKAWLRNVDLLVEHIGSLTPQHLWLYEQLIWDGRTRLRKNSELPAGTRAVTAALEKLAKHVEPKGEDPAYEKLRIEALMLEFTQMDLGDERKAEQLALRLIKTTQTDAGIRSSDRFEAYAWKMLARIHEDRQDWEGAEKHFRWAIRKREAAHGASNDLRVVRDMWVLAEHFQRAGRYEDATAIVQDAISRAEQYLKDLPG